MKALTHTYAPRGGCLALFGYRGGEVVISGPAGTGKSRACLEKVHACMLANPGARALVVRKTAESLSSTALVTWREYVAKEALAAGLVEFYGGSAEEPPQYRYTNGSRIMIGGMNNAGRIMSSEYDLVFAQEARELTLTDWEALTTRCRNGVMSFQQLLADTNPDRPDHWLARRAGAGTAVMLESRHTDNPRLFDQNADGTFTRTSYGESYMARLDALTGVRRLRLRDGKWVAAEGIIYEEYDPAVHLVEPFPIPWEWPRIWGIDFGIVLKHPMVIQMWAESPTGELYRYRELFGVGRTVDEWAYLALACVRRPIVENPDERNPAHWEWTEPKPQAVVCDHDAEGRVQFSRHTGLGTRPAHKRVREGIDAFKVRLRQRRVFLIRGALVAADPELVEAVRPTCFEEEIGGYVWDERKEAPVKDMDDACDVARYVVADRDLAARSSVRF